MVKRTVPGEIDVENLPSLAREEIVGLMNEQLRAEYRRIEARVLGEERRTLLAQHDLGRRVNRLRTDEARYGRHAVAVVAAAVGVDPSHLYRAAQFHEAFSDRGAVEKLTARRGAGGYRFGWSHVLQLIPVDDAARRGELVEVAFRDRLTVRQLSYLIHAAHDNRAGRPLRTVVIPRSLSGGLEQLQVMTAKLRSKFQTTLPECVLPHLAELSAEQLNEDVLARVARVREELTRLAGEAADGAAQIARLEPELARRASLPADGGTPPPVSPDAAADPRPRPAARRRERTRRPVEA